MSRSLGKKIAYGFTMLKAELSGKVDYWHLRERPLLPEEVSPEIYYLDMKGKGFYPGEMENGVPVFYLDGKIRCFFPITILNYGLGLLNRLHDGEDVQDELEKVLVYIMEHQDEDGAWRFEVPEGTMHEMAGGKVSGMTQGLAISFLTRCVAIGVLTRERAEPRIEAAKKKMLSQSCVSYVDGEPFIEEFNVPGASILNGSIFALLGLYDYENFVGEKEDFAIFEAALRTLLPRFRFGSWSYYNLQKTLCSKFYQQLHVDLMTVLEQLTGEGIYSSYRRIWKRGLRFSFVFILLKAGQKVFQIRKWSMNASSHS